MPLFEFVCRACDWRFETLVLGSRTAACPNCGSTSLEKLVSAFAAKTSGTSDAGSGACSSPFT